MRGKDEQRSDVYMSYSKRAAQSLTKQRAESDGGVSGSAGKQVIAPCPSRAAVVVSRKVSKSAVERNRLRRQVYESLRRQWDDISTPTDIAIIVHDGRLSELVGSQLDKRLNTSLHKALNQAHRSSPHSS